MEILLIGCNPIVATSRGAVDNSSSPPQTISWRRSPKLRNNTEHPQERFCADKSASTPVNAMKAKCGSERSHSLVSPIRTVSFTSDERNSSREITSPPDILCSTPLHRCRTAFLPYVLVQRTQRSAAALGCGYAETLPLAAYFWGLASGLEPVGQLSNKLVAFTDPSPVAKS